MLLSFCINRPWLYQTVPLLVLLPCLFFLSWVLPLPLVPFSYLPLFPGLPRTIPPDLFFEGSGVGCAWNWKIGAVPGHTCVILVPPFPVCLYNPRLLAAPDVYCAFRLHIDLFLCLCWRWCRSFVLQGKPSRLQENQEVVYF